MKNTISMPLTILFVILAISFAVVQAVNNPQYVDSAIAVVALSVIWMGYSMIKEMDERDDCSGFVCDHTSTSVDPKNPITGSYSDPKAVHVEPPKVKGPENCVKCGSNRCPSDQCLEDRK